MGQAYGLVWGYVTITAAKQLNVTHRKSSVVRFTRTAYNFNSSIDPES